MLTKSIPHTFIRNGYYYFSRRVPADLQGHYSYHRIVQGLRTTSPQKAKVQASITAAKLEAYWSQMRLAKSDVIGLSLVRDSSSSSQEVASNQPQTNCPSLLDALEVYLEQKGKGRPKTFRVAAERSCNYLIGLSGNKPLSHYTRQDALQFRDWLMARGLTGSSITRNFSYLKAVINFALSEYALDIRNPFVGVYHDRSAGVLVRKPIPIEAIRNVQSECHAIDDDMRWLIALISDTGMRLAEGAGLLKEDLVGLDTDLPCVRVTKHPWRNLKTSSSERHIPLIGEALWAAKRIVEADNGSDFAFPRYNRTSPTAANSVSAALNKWLKQYVPAGCTMHSFRHSMRDRLRAVQCPADMTDQIGGWMTDGVGQGYGSGYPLSVLREWLEKAK
ncbi:tyrosine-type recombinase/integrase [Planktomarina temperata]|nr:tyrosine-type recombinase/integrase [Planktomarina temperata]